MSEDLKGQEESQENERLITHEEVEGTPFHITGKEDEGYFLRLGNYRLTEYRASSNIVMEELRNEWWKVMINVIACVMEVRDKEKEIERMVKDKAA